MFMSSLVQDIQHKGQDLRKIGMTMMLLTNRESAVEHLVLEDVGEGGGVPGEEVGVPRRGQLAR